MEDFLPGWVPFLEPGYPDRLPNKNGNLQKQASAKETAEESLQRAIVR
jgi:hypothetical protein